MIFYLAMSDILLPKLKNDPFLAKAVVIFWQYIASSIASLVEVMKVLKI